MRELGRKINLKCLGAQYFLLYLYCLKYILMSQKIIIYTNNSESLFLSNLKLSHY